jgi:hypothetical protein
LLGKPGLLGRPVCLVIIAPSKNARGANPAIRTREGPRGMNRAAKNMFYDFRVIFKKGVAKRKIFIEFKKNFLYLFLKKFLSKFLKLIIIVFSFLTFFLFSPALKLPPLLS